ncbi:MAG TPA: alpha/beta hydrolase [Candidatus Udaeobacter sp.]|nr:alpha/beta hydrolase [Candidatus Udaeobacter sp.]
MKRNRNRCPNRAALGLFCIFSLFASETYAAPAAIASRTANIDDVQLHYLIAGSGPAVLLLHGYTQTSRMWRPLIPLLAEKFTVIAPDLPGIGDSSVPADNNSESIRERGIDLVVAAKQIHDLVRSLKIDKARVVGHDIGLMVAYAYAAQFPSETEKLGVMDAFLPGVPGWEPIYNAPNIWHFRFNGEYPEALVKGRERTYFEYFWNVLAADKTHSIPEADRKAYTEAYSRPGRMHAGWAYFVSWPQLAKDFAQLSQTKLTMPVLSIGGDKSLGNELAAQMKLVANDVTVVVLKDTGHWISEERPKETTDALLNFL